MNGPALYHIVKVWAWLDWYTRAKLVLRKMLSLAFDAFSEAMELLEIAEKRLRRLAMMRLGVGRCFFFFVAGVWGDIYWVYGISFYQHYRI